VLSDELVIVPTWLTYISYSFVHGGFLHLAGNLAFLWIFSDNVEDAMGHKRFTVFYALCAVAGAVMHGILFPSSDSPLIGASGAASGIVAAYLLLHPRVNVWVLVMGRVPVPLPSYIVLTLWILLFYDLDGDVAWGGHVGGIIAGAILIVFMKRSDVKLFAKPIVSSVKLDDSDAVDPKTG
jgi:membrane associated rhomboid family serine protease